MEFASDKNARALYVTCIHKHTRTYIDNLTIYHSNDLANSAHSSVNNHHWLIECMGDWCGFKRNALIWIKNENLIYLLYNMWKALPLWRHMAYINTKAECRAVLLTYGNLCRYIFCASAPDHMCCMYVCWCSRYAAIHLHSVCRIRVLLSSICT